MNYCGISMKLKHFIANIGLINIVKDITLFSKIKVFIYQTAYT